MPDRLPISPSKRICPAANLVRPFAYSCFVIQPTLKSMSGQGTRRTPERRTHHIPKGKMDRLSFPSPPRFGSLLRLLLSARRLRLLHSARRIRFSHLSLSIHHPSFPTSFSLMR